MGTSSVYLCMCSKSSVKSSTVDLDLHVHEVLGLRFDRSKGRSSTPDSTAGDGQITPSRSLEPLEPHYSCGVLVHVAGWTSSKAYARHVARRASASKQSVVLVSCYFALASTARPAIYRDIKVEHTINICRVDEIA